MGVNSDSRSEVGMKMRENARETTISFLQSVSLFLCRSGNSSTHDNTVKLWCFARTYACVRACVRVCVVFSVFLFVFIRVFMCFCRCLMQRLDKTGGD